MTRDEIISMAREAHQELVTRDYPGHIGPIDPWTLRLLEIFTALVEQRAVAAEREACAQICDSINDEFKGKQDQAAWCAHDIRARGER